MIDTSSQWLLNGWLDMKSSELDYFELFKFFHLLEPGRNGNFPWFVLSSDSVLPAQLAVELIIDMNLDLFFLTTFLVYITSFS